MRIFIGLVVGLCSLVTELRADLITIENTGLGRAFFFANDLNAPNSVWNYQGNGFLNFDVNESFQPVNSYRASGSASMSESYQPDSLFQSASSQFAITLPVNPFVFRNVGASATSFFIVTEPVKGVLDLNFGFENTSEYFASFQVSDSNTGDHIASGSVNPGMTQVEFNLSPGRYQLGIGYARSMQGTLITANESHSAIFESRVTFTSLSSVPEPSSLIFVASSIVLGATIRLRRRSSS